MQQKSAPRARLFVALALATATFTAILIIIGAIVRVTDSGLGCGNTWPLCNGSIFPPLDNITAWIEWSHRLVAMLIGVLGLATLIEALRTQRSNRLVLGAVIVAALLYAVQSTLGRQVVVLELVPLLVALHLGTAMLLFGALIVAVVAVRYHPTESISTDSVSALVYVTALLALVIVLTGALVRGSGATLACTTWPLCNGTLLPVNEGQPALIHMLHRFAVVALGIALLLMVWQVMQNRRARTARNVAALVLIAYLAQAGVGAFFVLTRAQPLWGAAHVGLAATTWALLVVLSSMEYLNNRAAAPRQDMVAWQS